VVVMGPDERGRKRATVGWRVHSSGQWWAEKLLGAGDAGGVVAQAGSWLRARKRGMAAAGWEKEAEEWWFGIYGHGC
jgi:hypothetical protein